jgi:hypothetical protein
VVRHPGLTDAVLACIASFDDNARMQTHATLGRPAARHSIAAALVAALLGPSIGQAADPKPKPATTAQQRADRAKGLELATETVQRISEAQLQVADRVLTGEAACELNQTVNIEPITGAPGHFRLRFKKVAYTMVPEETSSGAVRLEDKKAGMVWLQIPSKSMLMNAKAGQRMVDGCLHPEQRAALAAVEAAAKSAAPVDDKKP